MKKVRLAACKAVPLELALPLALAPLALAAAQGASSVVGRFAGR